MTDSQMVMAIAPPIPSPPDKWERFKQALLALYRGQTAQFDDVLTEEIMRTLAADHLLGRSDIAHMSVTVNDGIATLTGHVVQSIDKARAEAIAYEASGVTTVVNHLIGDDELMLEVAGALGRDQHTRSEQIQVNIQHGVVYLGGVVNRASVRDAAGQIAARVPHARGIINIVQTPGVVVDIQEDRFIQPRIESEIYATDVQVGHLQQVVINPQNRRVTAGVVLAQFTGCQEVDWKHLSCKQRQLQRCILIPISSVRRAQSGVTFLNVSGDQAARFADFDQRNVVAPPVDWQPPFPYTPADVIFYRF